MKRHHLAALSIASIGAVATLVAAVGPSAPPAPTGAPDGPDHPVERAGPPDRSDAPAGSIRRSEVTERGYRLRYARDVTLGGAHTAVRLAGDWTVLPLGPDRVQVTLALDDYTADGPAPRGLEFPFQLGYSDGRLSGVGYAPDVEPAARNLLTEIAASLTHTPGAGAEWQVDETDLNGTYTARYIRRDAGRVERTRIGYVGAHAKGATEGAITARGQARFEIDAHGPVEVRVDETIERAFSRLDLAASATIDAALTRESTRAVRRSAIRRLPLAPIAPVAEPAALRAAERNRIGDADLTTVVGWLDRLDDPSLDDRARQQLRAGLHAALRAALRLHPDGLDDYVAALRRAPADEARLLIGALGAAGTPASTEALTGLLDAGLPVEQVKAVHYALNRSASPSADSARTLLAHIDDPEVGTSAMLAAGNQARGLEDSAPEVAGDVVETLIARYAEAPDAGTRAAVVGALGNSGDPRALPTLRHALQTGDASLAGQAVYAHRFMPGAEVDATLEAALIGHFADAVRLRALSAIDLRDHGFWAGRLEALQPQLGGRPHVAAEVTRLLTRWAAGAVAAR